MTSTKAVAAGVAAQFVIIASWLVTLVPGWMSVPEPVQSAVHSVVSAGIAAVFVYYSPANKQTVEANDTTTPPDSEP